MWRIWYPSGYQILHLAHFFQDLFDTLEKHVNLQDL